VSIKSFLVAFYCCAVLAPTLLTAQCGYGTSEWDCQQRQREEANARQNDEMARQQQEQQQQQQQQYEQQQYEAANAPPPIPVNWVTSYAAIAWHVDAADVWATWNRRTEEGAKQAALEACNNVMGEGCTIAVSAWNSSIAIAQEEGGALWYGAHDTESKAKKKVLEDCRAGKHQCKIKYVFTARPWTEPANWTDVERQIAAEKINFFKDQFPDTAVARNVHVLVGWPEKKWTDKVWLVSGRQNYQQSEKLLLERCKRDSGVDCVVSQASVNGAVYRYMDSAAGTGWVAASSKKAAAFRMQEYCAKTKGKCSLEQGFDAQTPRLTVLESPPAGMRSRGFVAVAWPSPTQANWKNVLVTAGHESLQAAKTAAVRQCEEKSQSKCALIGDVDDGRFSLLGLYLDNKGSVRWYMNNSENQIEIDAQDDCHNADVNCKRLAIFDPKKSVSKILDISGP
jgi:hypothetical protein